MKQNYCNRCGRPLSLHEDALTVHKDWGYFSKKDLEIHEFILCEDCYDQMVQDFVMPITVRDKQEVLGS